MSSDSEPTQIMEFGRFRILPKRRELSADGVPIELGGRAFDVLMALIEARGTILGKDELIGRVWPGRIVEENNLQVQIAALRKALAGERDLIRTVAGRGYQFTGEIHAGPHAGAPAPANLSQLAPSPTQMNLPVPASELIGRDAELEEIFGLAADHRLVALTGAGGIGKTRLSLEVARQLLPRFADGVWLLELGPLSDPELVPVAVAGALGLTFASGTLTPERVAAALSTKQVLLVLDNCEHLVEATARLAEALLRASAGVCVLATSREPLRVEGECVYHVPPLAVPEGGAEPNQEVLRHGAVKLFIARAREADPQFSPDGRIAAIAAICRRLDGIPLALELAAARTVALGVDELVARLDDRFKVLTGGLRTALPRHQTLRATLDWSYDMLSDGERVIMRRLAVFAGSFTLESAAAVAASVQIPTLEVVDHLANLVEKSLVTADVGRAVAQYRLLETTRVYALEKLAQSGELEGFARRHAEYYQGLLEQAAAERDARPAPEWLATYGRHLDNVRAALDWAFSGGGDSGIGVALTVAAVPLWTHLSLMDECRRRVEQALGAPSASRGARRDMQLYAALGAALLYTRGPIPEIRSVWTNALDIADSLEDTDYRLRALWGLWVDGLTSGDFPGSLAFAQTFSGQAASAADLAVGDRMAGISLLYLGRLATAREHIERMLSRYIAPVHGSHVIRFQFDQRVMARMTLSQILWLQGFPDRAMQTVRSNVDYALSIDHALSLCNALGQAAHPIALLTGDLAAAERFLTLLSDTTVRSGLTNWYGFIQCFRGVLLIRRGDIEAGSRALRDALSEFPRAGWALRYTAFSGDGELAEALSRAGEAARALGVIDDALARSERNEERWCVAELLRIKGELVLRTGASDCVAAAQAHFLEGIGWARLQGALSWELRCATGLARLWHEQGRTSQARELLAPVYARFTEGFGTADLKAAQALLETLQ